MNLFTKTFHFLFKKEYWHFKQTPEIIEIPKLKELILGFAIKLENIKYPDNLFNKTMGLVQQSFLSFRLIITRYHQSREGHHRIFIEQKRWEKQHPDARSHRAHPEQMFQEAAIRVDVESLFTFGTILVTRSLLLFELYLPDSLYLNKKGENQYRGIPQFYKWLSSQPLSPLSEELKLRLLPTIKWLYAVLRIYRNEFVEHMDRPYQQGMLYNFYGKNSFRLMSYKWGEISTEEEDKISKLKSALIKEGVKLPVEKSSRHFVQILFENITHVPEHLFKDALSLVEEVGVESPEPELLIQKITEYMEITFSFLEVNLDKSRLEKYRS